ncbi:MAG: hypothetical protein KDH91_00485 [Rhodoferax sp.]|nr:hypothetical protein [Rhodoferax sp.]
MAFQPNLPFMPRFSNTDTKRRTGCMVLLAWLLALAAGWANACLLQEREMHGQGGPNGAALAAHVAHAASGHVSVDSEHAGSLGQGNSVGLKVCDNDNLAIFEPVSKVDPTKMPLASPTAFAYPDRMAVTRLGLARWAFPLAGPVVPLRTLFVRLAL